MLGIFRILKEPYPVKNNPGRKILIAIGAGISVFIALWLFQPFEIDLLKHEQKINVIVGYGVLASLNISFVVFVIPFLLSNQYTEEIWVVWKEITIQMFALLLVAGGCLAFSHRLGFYNLTATHLIKFEFTVFFYGIIPVGLIVMGKQLFLSGKHKEHAKELNYQLTLTTHKDQEQEKASGKDPDIDLNGIHVLSENLMLFRRKKNTVYAFYMENNTVKKTALDFSIQKMYHKLSHKEFYLCHPGSIVNINAITKFIGNAQGLKIMVDNINEPVPVSREMVRKLGRLITSI